MDIIHFETLGCKLNQIETESLAHAFSEAGFNIDEGIPDAENPDDRQNTDDGHTNETDEFSARIDLCVINTCTVTGKAEQKARRLIRLLLAKYPEAPILVTGCYAEVEGGTIAAINPRITVFPGSRKGELAELPEYLKARRMLHPEEPVSEALAAFTNRTNAAAGTDSDTFRLSTDNFLFHSRASIKIQDGCDNKCSYCRIRLARGKAVSLESSEVIDRIKKIEDAHWGEVILAGVNLSQYRSTDGNFAHLLARILKETNTIAIRISSLYPERIDEEILPMLANKRVRPHFHLSVQSGSDRILASMRRPYNRETVFRAAERLRTVKENPFLACDIITGYPGETDEDFALTLDLCEKIGFAWIHAFPFSPRPLTEAWNMKPRIPERIAGERVALLTDLAKKNHEKYISGWIGRELDAIVESDSTGKHISVLTENYIPARLAITEKPSESPSANRIIPDRGSQIRVLLETDRTAFFVV